MTLLALPFNTFFGHFDTFTISPDPIRPITSSLGARVVLTSKSEILRPYVGVFGAKTGLEIVVRIDSDVRVIRIVTNIQIRRTPFFSDK